MKRTESLSLDERLVSLVRTLRRTAEQGTWTGQGDTTYFRRCRQVDATIGLVALFTRDVGHHTSGWWKSPLYERCRHLSLSFFDPETGGRLPRNRNLTDRMLAALFGRHRRWLWCEPPYTTEGKRADVWHYRLFCDKGWVPLKPRGEVYTRGLTEAGWLSYSDLNAFLEAAGRGAVDLSMLPAANVP